MSASRVHPRAKLRRTLARRVLVLALAGATVALVRGDGEARADLLPPLQPPKMLGQGATPPSAAAADAPSKPAAPAPVDPDAPTVAGKLDPGTFRVGDPITFTVTSTGHVPVNLPTTMELGAFSLLDRKEEEKDLGGGRRQRVFTLTLAAYEPGDLTIPPVAVTYIGKGGEVRTLETEAQPVHVVSLLANEPEPALKENAPAVTVWQEDWRLVIAAGVLLAAALGAGITWLVVRKLRARVIVRPGPPPRPAHEIALEKLDRLGSYGLFENADNRPFYFALSEIIREYFGNRYGFDSLELTTDELVAELRRHAGPELVVGEVEGWLSGCDLVKFAKISPSATEARGVMEVAIRIVESTRARPEPQATADNVRAATPAGADQAAAATAHAHASGLPHERRGR